MYNERSENFSIRDIVLQILFVALFIFILLWLFPTKGDLKREVSKIKVEPLAASDVFNENVASMREAAKMYFTTARLPKNVGDKASMNLSEMLNKKLLLPFVDSQGNQCDSSNSYVEITKMDEEYTMKVNLKCSDNDDYIIVHMGCYNYCEADICEKNDKEITKPTVTPTKPTKPTPTKTAYSYEYMKLTDGHYTDWSSWSNWSTNKVSETKLRDVKTKKEDTYYTEKRVVAYKTITYQEPVYQNKYEQITTRQIKTCERYGTVYTTTGSTYGEHWSYTGTVTLGYTPTDTSTKIYVYVPGSSNDTDCGDCSSSLSASYKVYELKSYQVKTGEYQCVEYGYENLPVYMVKEVFVGYNIKTKQEPVYGYVKVPTTVTYYSYRTRKYVDGTKSIKWSYYNDKKLLNAGYEYTGKKVVVK